MNKEIFRSLITSSEVLYFAFLCLAHELISSKQTLSFGKPFYRNSKLGISLIIENELSLNYLDLCLLAMDYDPLLEFAARRVIMFPSIEDKNEFRNEFRSLYNVARGINKKLNGMNPSLFYLMACTPKPIKLMDENNFYSVILSVKMGSELFKTLWLEEINRLSKHNQVHIEKLADTSDWENIKITFINKVSRDNYLEQLSQDTETFKSTLAFYQNACNNEDTLEVYEVMFLLNIETIGHDLWPDFDVSESNIVP
jgi:hypothetical protein